MKRSRPSRSHSKIVFAASIVFMEFSYISTNIPLLYRYFVQNIQSLRLDLVRISSFSGAFWHCAAQTHRVLKRGFKKINFDQASPSIVQ